MVQPAPAWDNPLCWAPSAQGDLHEAPGDVHRRRRRVRGRFRLTGKRAGGRDSIGRSHRRPCAGHPLGRRPAIPAPRGPVRSARRQPGRCRPAHLAPQAPAKLPDTAALARRSRARDRALRDAERRNGRAAHLFRRRGDPNALADFHPTNGDRVVTVCAAGKTSMLAAERLRPRGVDAVSLEGGMRAWSLAWNTAEVPCPGSTARIVQLRRTGKGCLSYLIGSNGDAVVIDVSLDPHVYQRVADTNSWYIRTVLETHVHADHLSRARAVAVETGARLCLPTTARVSFQYAPLKDGDTLRVGSAGLRVFHTPGHTPESACYLLSERALFTGDTLFLGAVGRPDL